MEHLDRTKYSPRLHASTLKTLHALNRKRKCHTILFLKQKVKCLFPFEHCGRAVLAKLSVLFGGKDRKPLKSV
ncbi:hypothetical protein CapIbe_017796 [Capra ibex]